MVDRYTKIVLTLIAGALVIIAAQNGLKTAIAQQTPGCGNVGVGQVPCTVTWPNPLPVVAVITH